MRETTIPMSVPVTGSTAWIDWTGSASSGGSTGSVDGIERRVGRSLERAYAAADAAADHVEGVAGAGRSRQLRIRVTERGRQVVNLRIPIAFVETALRFVPGLGGEQAQRIRDAVRAGAVGPILDVEDVDGEGGVLISVE